MWLDRFEPLKGVVLRLWGGAPLPRRMRSWIYWLVGSKYVVGVQGLVFDAEGRLLLLRHTYKGRYPWGLPGGGLARGESTAEAVIREVREEAGLDVSVERVLAVETHPNRLLIEVFYLCRAHGGAFRPNAEISGYRYVEPARLPPDLEPRLRRMILRIVAARQASTPPGVPADRS